MIKLEDLQPGMRVLLKSNPVSSPYLCWVGSMDSTKGCVVTVSEVYSWYFSIEENIFSYSAEWVESIVDDIHETPNFNISISSII